MQHPTLRLQVQTLRVQVKELRLQVIFDLIFVIPTSKVAPPGGSQAPGVCVKQPVVLKEKEGERWPGLFITSTFSISQVACFFQAAPATSCKLSERPPVRENCLGACSAEEDDGGSLSDDLETEQEESEIEELEEREEELLEELLEEEEEKERTSLLEKAFVKEKSVRPVVTVIESHNIKDTQSRRKEVMIEERSKKAGRKSDDFEDKTNLSKSARMVEMSNEIVVEKHKKAWRGPTCKDKFKNCQITLFFSF